MAKPTLYTANQVAVAAVAAAKIFGVPAELIVRGEGAELVGDYVSFMRARKALAFALADVNRRPVARVALALGWHASEASAASAYSRAMRKGEPSTKQIIAVREALMRACSGDPATLADYARDPRGKKLEPAGQFAAPAGVLDAPDPGAPSCARNAGEALDDAAIVQAPRRSAPCPPARAFAGGFGSAPERRTADYSKMTEAQIAEHEAVEAMLAAASKTDGAYRGALLLAGAGMKGPRA